MLQKGAKTKFLRGVRTEWPRQQHLVSKKRTAAAVLLKPEKLPTLAGSPSHHRE
jgi:hypothetical protein